MPTVASASVRRARAHRHRPFLEPDSPIVVVDTKTGRRWPLWAELDMNSPPDNRALIVRPATNFLEGRRYVVAVRRLVDATGTPLPASAAFAAYRDGVCTTDPTFESRRAHMEDVFKTLARAGVERGDLQLAWTSPSRARARSPAGCSPCATTRSAGSEAGPGVHDHVGPGEPGGGVQAPNPGDVPGSVYMTGNGAPDNAWRSMRSAGPTRQATPYVATFTCNLPQTPAPSPAG
jgi:hypothetical protein